MSRFLINEAVRFTGRLARVPYGAIGRVSFAHRREQEPQLYNVIFDRHGEYTVGGGDLRRVEIVNGVVQEETVSQAVVNLCLALWSVSLAVRPLGNVVVYGDKVAVFDESGAVLVEYPLVDQKNSGGEE